MLIPVRDKDDPTRIAEYQETRRKLSDTEAGRKLLEAHDRLIEAIDRLVEDWRARKRTHAAGSAEVDAPPPRATP